MDLRINNLEFKIFFRNKAAWSGILILLLSGFAGMYFGKNLITQQQKVIEKARILQQENTERNIKYFGNDLGTLLYHNKFSMVNVPDNWAAFSTGQRDINPYLTSVTMLALEGQMYDTDLNNPYTLLLGNMDMTFVFIFLFPLVIIAFSYNQLSAEKESGIWSIVRSQSASLFKVIWRKFSVRVISIFITAIFLLVTAAFYLDLAFDLRFVITLIVISLYLSFWFSFCFWIISLGRSSSFNAVTLISCWIALNVVAPSILNVWLTERFPVPEALETVVKQREGYHEKWDMDKHITMDKFFKHYPQFKAYPFPEDKEFSWFWYYAMQQMGDDESVASTQQMSAKLMQRQHFTNMTSFFLPGIQAQLQLNELAGSDLQNHLQFLKALKAYHEKLRLYFYPVIFSEATTETVDWKKFKVEDYSSSSQKLSSYHLLTVSIVSILLFFMAMYNIRKLHS